MPFLRESTPTSISVSLQNQCVNRGLGISPSRWKNVTMATKRTKADKAQRQADQLDKKSERRLQQETSKRKVRKDSGRAA
jgi:hypothetical protein